MAGVAERQTRSTPGDASSSSTTPHHPYSGFTGAHAPLGYLYSTELDICRGSDVEGSNSATEINEPVVIDSIE